MLKYELDKLGWLDFESLVQTLLAERLGLGVEAWGGSGDYGIDAYYADELPYPTKRACPGPFLFQCKFVVNANAAGAKPEAALLSAVDKECKRIATRILPRKPGSQPKWPIQPKHYSLVTNAPVSPTTRTAIFTALKAVLPSCVVHIHQGRDICNWINLLPHIIQRFPQLFTISDLGEFLRRCVNSNILSRSEVAIKMAEAEAKTFVPTNAYYEALARLGKYCFVVLEGPPEMGKTTIGRIIALAQLGQGWEAIECKNPKEFHSAYDKEKGQVFVGDDFFGRTDYEPTRVSLWQAELPYILGHLDKRHWLILTSRAHLLKMGKHDLDVAGYNDRFPTLGEVVVNAGDLSRLEKARILYRHAKSMGLSDVIKAEIRKRVSFIVDHRHYTPLRIKNLVVALSKETPSETSA